MEIQTFQFKEDLLVLLKECSATAGNDAINLPPQPIDTALFQELKELLANNGGDYKKKGNFFTVKAGDASTLLEAAINTVQDEINREKEPEPVKEKRTLRHDLDQQERDELGRELAALNKKVAGLKDSKKSVTKQFDAQIAEADASIGRISNLVHDGYEYRETDVEIIYNKPATGQKTIKRMDTLSEAVEKMDAYEWNLFNQPREEFSEEESR